MDVDRAMDYLDFVVNRHRIWEYRQDGFPGPWTTDPVLQTRKFTNVFRVLDPGSQFVLTDLLPGVEDLPRDFLARCVLYRMTNRPDTWRALRDELGFYPSARHLGVGLGDTLAHLRDEAGVQIFSGAYIVMPRPGVPGVDKARAVAELAAEVMAAAWHPFRSARTLRARYEALRVVPGIGDFLAMQIVTDFGYGFPSDEDSFVVAGPGARAGAAALTGSKTAESALAAIRWAATAGAVTEDWPTLTTPRGRRVPSYMDLQNTFCEFSKYVRYEARPNDRAYVPAHPGPQPKPVLPAHW